MFGGLIAILTAIWIYRTAIEAKTGNAVFWVAGSFVVFISLHVLMIYFNMTIIEIFDRDVGSKYDSAGGLNVRDTSDTAGLQSGTGGTLIGIIFEILPVFVPFLAIAVIRLLLMLKQPFAIGSLFGGIKEMFVSIGKSFKPSE